jgi:hypothetical protein
LIAVGYSSTLDFFKYLLELKVTKDLQMNSTPKRFRNETLRTLVLVIATIVVTVIVVITEPWACQKLGWKHKISDDLNDTAQITNAIKQSDSVETVDGEVGLNDFVQNYSVEDWFNNFKSNKVSFDNKYDGNTIDVIGRITEIKTDFGCALIVMQSADNPYESIEFSNCPQNKDGWRDEVAQIAVGDTTHIFGKYDANLSSSSRMYIYKCHIKK